MDQRIRQVRYIATALAALSLALSLFGCVAMPSLRVRPTAMPIEGVDDPGQPARPPDFSGLILRVTADSLVLQPSGKHLRREDEEAPSGTAGPTASPKRTVEISVPLADGVVIRQSRSSGDEVEFVDLQLYEIIPGQYATVWIDGDDAAQYVRISMRARVKEQ